MKKYFPLLLLSFPLIVSAQQRFQGLLGFIRDVGGLIKLLIPLVAGLALLFFFWGLAKTVFSAGNEKAREEGKSIMLYGIVALFVMISIWGLVAFLQAQFGLPNAGGPSQTTQTPLSGSPCGSDPFLYDQPCR